MTITELIEILKPIAAEFPKAVVLAEDRSFIGPATGVTYDSDDNSIIIQ